MPRVILTLLLLCQPFCLPAAEVGFADPGLLNPDGPARSRVVIVHDSGATRALSIQPEAVATMVERGVTAFTGQPNPRAAWQTLVTPQDVVGIKVHSSPGAASGTRPAVAAALIRGLLDAGHPADQIILWDRKLADLRTAGFAQLATQFGIRLAGAADSGFDSEVAYENQFLGQLVFGDLEFERSQPATEAARAAGRRSHMSRLLTREITRHILVAPLLNHPHAGVSGILYTTACAATDNFQRFEANPNLLADAVPDIFVQTSGTNRVIADRVALCIVDALIGQYEGMQRTFLQYAAAVNELRFATDPVALDTLSLEELNRIRERAGAPPVTNRFALYTNARLLELGTDDTRRLDIVRVDPTEPSIPSPAAVPAPPADPASTSPSAPPSTVPPDPAPPAAAEPR